MRKAARAVLFSAASVTAFAAPAMAQDAGGADIIVTARRSEERLQDVPISITVFNQEQLTNRNVVNSADLAAFTPSLSVNDNFGSTNSAFAIRGFVQDVGTQPSVGVYFADVVAPRGAANNVPIGDGAGPGSFFDLQNVQVLKGPQGTLQGRNTTGGAILLVPQKPTGDLAGYVEGSIGNYDMRRVQAVFNVPVTDTMRVRFGIDRQKRDGFVRNTTGVGADRFGDVDYLAARASLVADLTPDLENYTIASYVRSDTVGDVQKLIACDPASTSLFAPFACAQLARERARGSGFYTAQSIMPNPRTLLNQWQIINTTTWTASDALTVRNIVSYAELKQKVFTPIFGTDFQLTGPSDAFYFANLIPIQGLNTADQSTFTEEFQLQGKALDGSLNWQGGAYLEVSSPLALSGNFTPNLLHCDDVYTFNCTNPLNFGTINYTATKTSFRNVGLYAQATYSLTDQLKLTGGLRYTWDRARADAILKTFFVAAPGVGFPVACNNPDLAFPDCAANYSTSSKKPTWMVDLEYKPVSDILLYAKYSRGFRAGGLAPQAPTQFAIFRPEKVDTYELGLKAEMNGPVRGTLNIAAFYNDFTNQQLQLNLLPKVPVSPASGILNAGKSRIQGIEVEASITPFEGLTVDASYAYLDTKLQRVNTPPDTDPIYSIVSPGRVGDPLTLSPKNKFSITGTYALPLPEEVGKIAFSATFTHTDRQLANYGFHSATTPQGAALSYLAPRNILNLNASWSDIAGLPVDLGLFATNVTKKKYYNFIPDLYTSPFLGFATATLAPPRMYGVRLRYHFGD